MLPFGSLPWFELARFRRSRLTRAALVAVAIVPLFYGVLYVWANWNPTGHLDKVQAAVVNQDAPVTITGQDGKKQTVPLGRSLAGKLTAGGNDENFDWVLTTPADAAKGLRDGTYAAQLTIPKDFSAAATSTAGDAAKAVQARLSLETNDAQNYLAGTIARQVGAAATDALNAQVSTGYLSNVYLGFSTLHGKLGDAADGATQLSSGAGRLADGVGRLDQGTGQLVVGLNQLAGGTAQLPGQTAQLNRGAQQLASGAAALSSGLGQLSAGTANLPAQAKLLDAGAASVVTGAGQLATGAGNVTTGAGFVASGLTNLSSQLTELESSCAASGASTAFCSQLGAASAGAGMLKTAATGVGQGATFVKAGADQLASGAQQLHSGTSALAATAPALSGGIAQTATGAAKLSAGAGQLAAGTAQLAGAAPQLSSGIAQAAGGAQQLKSGTGKLYSGAQKLGTGSGQLASGLRDGVAQVPNYSSSERQHLSTVAATPVVTDTVRQHDVKTYGAGFAPYFMALALWVGAMAIFMLLRALSPRSLASTAPSPRVALASYWPGAVMAGIQAVLLVLVLYFVVGLTPARLPLLFGFAILISLTFAAINQALIATFGGAGRFLALILISLQLTTAGGTYPIDTAPAFFGWLHPFLPMTYAVEGLRTAIAGGGQGLGADVVVLLIWAALGFAITFLAAHRQRTWSVARLHATAVV